MSLLIRLTPLINVTENDFVKVSPTTRNTGKRTSRKKGLQCGPASKPPNKTREVRRKNGAGLAISVPPSHSSPIVSIKRLSKAALQKTWIQNGSSTNGKRSQGRRGLFTSKRSVRGCTKTSLSGHDSSSYVQNVNGNINGGKVQHHRRISTVKKSAEGANKRTLISGHGSHAKKVNARKKLPSSPYPGKAHSKNQNLVHSDLQAIGHGFPHTEGFNSATPPVDVVPSNVRHNGLRQENGSQADSTSTSDNHQTFEECKAEQLLDHIDVHLNGVDEERTVPLESCVITSQSHAEYEAGDERLTYTGQQNGSDSHCNGAIVDLTQPTEYKAGDQRSPCIGQQNGGDSPCNRAIVDLTQPTERKAGDQRSTYTRQQNGGDSHCNGAIVDLAQPIDLSFSSDDTADTSDSVGDNERDYSGYLNGGLTVYNYKRAESSEEENASKHDLTEGPRTDRDAANPSTWSPPDKEVAERRALLACDNGHTLQNDSHEYQVGKTLQDKEFPLTHTATRSFMLPLKKRKFHGVTEREKIDLCPPGIQEVRNNSVSHACDPGGTSQFGDTQSSEELPKRGVITPQKGFDRETERVATNGAPWSDATCEIGGNGGSHSDSHTGRYTEHSQRLSDDKVLDESALAADASSDGCMEQNSAETFLKNIPGLDNGWINDEDHDSDDEPGLKLVSVVGGVTSPTFPDTPTKYRTAVFFGHSTEGELPYTPGPATLQDPEGVFRSRKEILESPTPGELSGDDAGTQREVGGVSLQTLSFNPASSGHPSMLHQGLSHSEFGARVPDRGGTSSCSMATVTSAPEMSSTAHQHMAHGGEGWMRGTAHGTSSNSITNRPVSEEVGGTERLDGAHGLSSHAPKNADSTSDLSSTHHQCSAYEEDGAKLPDRGHSTSPNLTENAASISDLSSKPHQCSAYEEDGAKIDEAHGTGLNLTKNAASTSDLSSSPRQLRAHEVVGTKMPYRDATRLTKNVASRPEFLSTPIQRRTHEEVAAMMFNTAHGTSSHPTSNFGSLPRLSIINERSNCEVGDIGMPEGACSTSTHSTTNAASTFEHPSTSQPNRVESGGIGMPEGACSSSSHSTRDAASTSELPMTSQPNHVASGGVGMPDADLGTSSYAGDVEPYDVKEEIAGEQPSQRKDERTVVYQIEGETENILSISRALSVKVSLEKLNVREKEFVKVGEDAETHNKIGVEVQDSVLPILDTTPASSPEKRLQCGICCQPFPNERALNTHFMTHLLGKPYRCSSCDEGFKRYENMKKHEIKCKAIKNLSSLRVALNRREKCKFCKKTQQQENMKKHEIKCKAIQNLSTLRVALTRREKAYQCKVCKKIFRSDLALSHHIGKSHIRTEGTLFKCPICSKAFPKKTACKNHIKFIHVLEKHHKCEVCGKMFHRRTDVNKHMVRHGPERKFSCDICDKKFFMKYSLMKHKDTHSKELRYTCNVCGEKFTTYASMYHHKVRVHATEEEKAKRRRQCNVCGKMFNEKAALKAHMNTHTNERKYKCEICGKSFNRYSTLFSHTKYVHTDERPYKCDQCGVAYKQKVLLMNHMNCHLSLRPYKCTVCGRAFKVKSHLYIHGKVVHERVRPFGCEICGLYFSNRLLRNRHMLVHDENHERWECKLCDKTFAYKYGLERHHQVNHENIRRFRCKFCDIPFGYKQSLQFHISSVHMKEAPYSCPWCPKKFCRQSALLLHKRIHTGEKPHKCKYCGKGFPQKNQLDSHIRTHTKEKPFQCEYCDQRFGHKSSMHSHIRTFHTFEKPYLCKVCGKAFAEAHQRSSHMHVHTKELNPLKCYTCNRIFCSKVNTRKHIRVAHGGVDIKD